MYIRNYLADTSPFDLQKTVKTKGSHKPKKQSRPIMCGLPGPSLASVLHSAILLHAPSTTSLIILRTSASSFTCASSQDAQSMERRCLPSWLNVPFLTDDAISFSSSEHMRFLPQLFSLNGRTINEGLLVFWVRFIHKRQVSKRHHSRTYRVQPDHAVRRRGVAGYCPKAGGMRTLLYCCQVRTIARLGRGARRALLHRNRR